MNKRISRSTVTFITVLSIASIFVLVANINPLQQQSAYAQSAKTSDLKQEVKHHMDQDNLCNRSDGCKQTTDGQQITGNDNTASSFNDQSTNSTRSLFPKSAASSTGTPGPAGPAGPTRTAVVTERTGDFATITPGTFGSPEASCNPGEIATGGGYRFTPSGVGVTPPYISGSRASADNLGWVIEAFNPGTSNTAVIPFAECLKLVP